MLTIWIGLVVMGTIAILFVSRMRMMQQPAVNSRRTSSPERYKPMLRLLDKAEFEFAGSNKALRRRMIRARHRIFRDYLRCLAKEYGQLLAGIRLVILNADEDRADLARMLLRSRLSFALALCRIECRLQMHAMGIGDVDASGLVRAIESLRSAHTALIPVAPAA
jgi:hypothetical protein